jgi:hypothetical protein
MSLYAPVGSYRCMLFVNIAMHSRSWPIALSPPKPSEEGQKNRSRVNLVSFLTSIHDVQAHS